MNHAPLTTIPVVATGPEDTANYAKHRVSCKDGKQVEKGPLGTNFCITVQIREKTKGLCHTFASPSVENPPSDSFCV